WHGDLPSERQLQGFRADLAARRAMPPATMSLLRECARAGVDPMDALRIAAGTMSMTSDDPRTIVAQCPTIVAAFWRLRRGAEPLEPRTDLDHAANFLFMLSGDRPDSEHVRGLETYLNTVV